MVVRNRVQVDEEELEEIEKKTVDLLKKFGVEYEEKGNKILIKGEMEYMDVMSVYDMIKTIKAKNSGDDEFGFDDYDTLLRVCVRQKGVRICFDMAPEENALIVHDLRNEDDVSNTEVVSLPRDNTKVAYDGSRLMVYFIYR
jgi:hypothetical protein